MTLSNREKKVVTLAAGFLCLLFVIFFVVLPIFDRLASARRGIGLKERELKEIAALRAEYLALASNTGDSKALAARRPGDFTLFSFLESAAGEARIKERIQYMKPSVSSEPGPYREATVEMKLEGVTLKQVAAYLYAVESPEYLVHVRRLSLREGRAGPGYLDVVLLAATQEVK
jgi:general secretion pathway protein M